MSSKDSMTEYLKSHGMVEDPKDKRYGYYNGRRMLKHGIYGNSIFDLISNDNIFDQMMLCTNPFSSDVISAPNENMLQTTAFGDNQVKRTHSEAFEVQNSTEQNNQVKRTHSEAFEVQNSTEQNKYSKVKHTMEKVLTFSIFAQNIISLGSCDRFLQ